MKRTTFDSTEMPAEELAATMVKALVPYQDRFIDMNVLDHLLQRLIPQRYGILGSRLWTHWHAALDLVHAGSSGWRLVTDGHLRIGLQRRLAGPGKA